MKFPTINAGLSTVLGITIFAGFFGISSLANASTDSTIPTRHQSLMKSTQTERDQLSADEISSLDIIPESTRWIGDDETAMYWAAKQRDEKGELVCLIAVLHESKNMGLSCSTAESFERNGSKLRVHSVPENPANEEYVESYLPPSGLSPRTLPEGLSEESSGLITGDTRGTKETAMTLEPDAQIKGRSSSSKLQFDQVTMDLFF